MPNVNICLLFVWIGGYKLDKTSNLWILSWAVVPDIHRHFPILETEKDQIIISDLERLNAWHICLNKILLTLFLFQVHFYSCIYFHCRLLVETFASASPKYVSLCADLHLIGDFCFSGYWVTTWVYQQRAAHVKQYAEKCCEQWETAGVGVGAGKSKDEHTAADTENSSAQCFLFSKE